MSKAQWEAPGPRARLLAEISAMRDRKFLAALISAAEARDCHLAKIEHQERKKRFWSKFSHISKGDLVFLHRAPEGRMQHLWGVPLRVLSVKPRAKLITVRHNKEAKPVILTPFMMDMWQLSLTPSVSAFANALKGATP